MTVEVLYFKGCPNHEPAVKQVRKALLMEGLTSAIDEVEIADATMAQKMSFLGSPTVRVNGLDIEPEARETGTFGFGCRTYADAEGRRSGLPPLEVIRQAARDSQNV